LSEKLKLSDKELKLIYLGAVVGAIASWAGNFVANAPVPPKLEFLGPLLSIGRVIVFFLLAWFLTIFLTVALEAIGFLKFE
jgi:hypothetical protein